MDLILCIPCIPQGPRATLLTLGETKHVLDGDNAGVPRNVFPRRLFGCLINSKGQLPKVYALIQFDSRFTYIRCCTTYAKGSCTASSV